MNNYIYRTPIEAIVKAAAVQEEQDRHLNLRKHADVEFQRFCAATPNVRSNRQWALWWIAGTSKHAEMLFRERWSQRPRADTESKLIRSMLFHDLSDYEIVEVSKAWMNKHGRHTPDEGEEVYGSNIRLKPPWLREVEKCLRQQKQETAPLKAKDRKRKNEKRRQLYMENKGTIQEKRKADYDPVKRHERYLASRNGLPPQRKGRKPAVRKEDMLQAIGTASTPAQLQKALDLNRDQVMYLLKRLVQARKVVKTGKGVYKVAESQAPASTTRSLPVTRDDVVALFGMYQSHAHPVASSQEAFAMNYQKYGYKQMYDAALKKWGAPVESTHLDAVSESTVGSTLFQKNTQPPEHKK